MSILDETLDIDLTAGLSCMFTYPETKDAYSIASYLSRLEAFKTNTIGGKCLLMQHLITHKYGGYILEYFAKNNSMPCFMIVPWPSDDGNYCQHAYWINSKDIQPKTVVDHPYQLGSPEVYRTYVLPISHRDLVMMLDDCFAKYKSRIIANKPLT